ncbi:MAG: FkbM family methyltransferase [Candidatus Sulfotelmatobacter sp.]
MATMEELPNWSRPLNSGRGQTFLKKVRVALTPRSALLRTRLQNGAIVEGYNRAGYGGRGVFVFGDSLEPELCHLQQFLSAGHVFVDVGANVGVFTVKAAKEVGKNGLVIAIEPFMETALRLSNNVRVNGYSNVRIRSFCIGAQTEPTRFYLNKRKPNSFSLVPNGNADSISVLSVSLDDLCRWEKLQRLDYLKIDAEGAEAAVLEGGRECIRRFRPIVQVEVTISGSNLDRSYRRFGVPRGINNLFIPAENARAIASATKLGWAEINAPTAV